MAVRRNRSWAARAACLLLPFTAAGDETRVESRLSELLGSDAEAGFDMAVVSACA